MSSYHDIFRSTPPVRPNNIRGGLKCSSVGTYVQNFRVPVTLTLDRDYVIRHTIMHHSSTSIYIPSFIEIGKTFFLSMDELQFKVT